MTLGGSAGYGSLEVQEYMDNIHGGAYNLRLGVDIKYIIEPTIELNVINSQDDHNYTYYDIGVGLRFNPFLFWFIGGEYSHFYITNNEFDNSAQSELASGTVYHFSTGFELFTYNSRHVIFGPLFKYGYLKGEKVKTGGEVKGRVYMFQLFLTLNAPVWEGF